MLGLGFVSLLGMAKACFWLPAPDEPYRRPCAIDSIRTPWPRSPAHTLQIFQNKFARQSKIESARCGLQGRHTTRRAVVGSSIGMDSGEVVVPFRSIGISTPWSRSSEILTTLYFQEHSRGTSRLDRPNRRAQCPTTAIKSRIRRKPGPD